MKTIFMAGFNSAPIFELGQPAVPEAPYKTVSAAQRNAIINQLSTAIDKAKILDDFIATKTKEDPGLQEAFGLDHTRFWALSNSIAPEFQAVEAVLGRMSDPDPQYWAEVSTEEAQKIKNWTVGIDEMMKILLKHAPEATQKTPPETDFEVKKDEIIMGAAAAAVVGALIYVLA